MARIKIDDLPQMNDVSLEQMQDILGAGPDASPLAKVYRSLTKKAAPPAEADSVVTKPRRKKSELGFRG